MGDDYELDLGDIDNTVPLPLGQAVLPMKQRFYWGSLQQQEATDFAVEHYTNWKATKKHTRPSLKAICEMLDEEGYICKNNLKWNMTSLVKHLKKAGVYRPRKNKKGAHLTVPAVPPKEKARANFGFFDSVKGEKKSTGMADAAERLREDQTKVERLRRRAMEDFWVFTQEVMQNPGLDWYFHGLLAQFMMHGESHEIEPGDYYWATREDLRIANGRFTQEYRIAEDVEHTTLATRLRKDPTNMDGNFRGLVIRICKDSSFKQAMLPRGHLKTTMLNVYFNLWLLIRDPNETILSVMNSTLNAKNVVREMQSHFENNDVFRACFPEIIPEHLKVDDDGNALTKHKGKMRWQSDRFDVPRSEEKAGFLGRRETSIVGFGIGGRLVSQHFTRRLYDDIVDDKSVATPEQIQKRIKDFQALQSLGVGDITRDLYVGTPWDYGDVSQWLLDPSLSGVPRLNVFIATALDSDEAPVYPKHKGLKTHPGFTSPILKKIKNMQRRGGLWSSQYLMQPVTADAQSFQPGWWKFYDGLPLDVNVATVVTVDPAISEKKHGDYSAFVVVSVDSKGRWFVREVQRHRGLGMPGILGTIRELNAKYKPDLIGIEATSFQRSILYALHDQSLHQKMDSLPLKEVVRSTTESKEFRIRKISPRVQAGMVYLPIGDKNLPWEMRHQRPYLSEGLQTLVTEGERFPKIPNDDVIDALASVAEMDLVPFSPIEQNKPKTLHEEIMESHSNNQFWPQQWDPILGSEW